MATNRNPAVELPVLGAEQRPLSPELLTPDQVAELLQVETALLRRWRYERRGPASFKVGKYVRYRRADLLAWIEEQRSATEVCG